MAFIKHAILVIMLTDEVIWFNGKAKMLNIKMYILQTFMSKQPMSYLMISYIISDLNYLNQRVYALLDEQFPPQDFANTCISLLGSLK